MGFINVGRIAKPVCKFSNVYLPFLSLPTRRAGDVALGCTTTRLRGFHDSAPILLARRH